MVAGDTGSPEASVTRHPPASRDCYSEQLLRLGFSRGFKLSSHPPACKQRNFRCASAICSVTGFCNLSHTHAMYPLILRPKARH